MAARPRAPAITAARHRRGSASSGSTWFRGLALWLIFIDHLPPNLLTWFTIRNYGFS